MKKSEEIAKNLLCMAGITINGSKEADIHIIQPDFYKYVLANRPLEKRRSERIRIDTLIICFKQVYLP